MGKCPGLWGLKTKPIGPPSAGNAKFEISDSKQSDLKKQSQFSRFRAYFAGLCTIGRILRGFGGSAASTIRGIELIR